jgi:hypothetical protein
MGSSFKKYNTVRDFQDSTHVLKLVYPGIGDTGETLTIRSQYSKEFREAKARATRQITTMTIARKGKDLDDDEVKLIEDTQFASLIAGWSFEEECTVENIIEFLDANPQVYDLINTTAAQDTLFLKKVES